MRDFPVVTLEVRALGETVTACFGAHAEEVSKQVQEIVSQTIKDFNFAVVVQQKTNQVLNIAVDEALRTYFIHGDGRSVVNAAIANALKAPVNG